MKNKTIFRKICILTTPILIATIGLIIWMTVVTQTNLVYASAFNRQGLDLSEAITSIVSGNISYTGSITGTHIVWAGAFTSTYGGPPLYAFQRDGLGTYTITISEAGVYYIMGGMDGDDSGGPPDPEHDPLGIYSGNPIEVSANQVITGIDFELIDPGTPPGDTGSISGSISYNGAITQTHNIIIYASKVGIIGPPSYYTIIPAVGAYIITGMEEYTYTIGAFLDVGDDMGPPGPADPFGFYDPSGYGYPQEIWVPSDPMVNGIDIVLADPLLQLFLPVIVR